MNQINQTSRALITLVRNRCTELKVTSRCMTNLTGMWEPVVFTNTPTLPDSMIEKMPVSETDEKKPDFVDRKVLLTLLRKSFDKKGLKIGQNRDNLVLDFFNLSKAVSDNQISVDDFVASKTFKELQAQIEYNIDILGNAQIINIMASVIKMRLSPTINLVKLLEHEIKFRMKKFNLNQTVKILKFYNSIELSSEQKEITDMLSYRIRTCIQNEISDIKDLNTILHLTASRQLPSTLLPLVEERLLEMLVITEDDDLVSKYIVHQEVSDYDTLCDLFIKLSQNKRRPTPLLKAASVQLCKLSLPDGEGHPKTELITKTLNALVSLTYPNQQLVGKLMTDLTKVVNLQNIDSYEMCNILRCISSLKWRPDELLEKFFEFFKADRQSALNHHVAISLLHVCALLDYTPQSLSLNQFYNTCLGAGKEELLQKSPRKWLNYVWSLTVLQIGNQSHIESILSEEFFQSLDTPELSINFSDAMKLLNLHAIATEELKLNGLNRDHLAQLEEYKPQRSLTMQKYVDRVREALTSMVESPEDLKHDIKTSFGFNIDTELQFRAKLESQKRKFALIFASYDDMITNSRKDIVGHKKIAARILKSIGLETIFLPETLINREKTSADITDKLMILIQDSTSSTKDAAIANKGTIKS